MQHSRIAYTHVYDVQIYMYKRRGYSEASIHIVCGGCLWCMRVLRRMHFVAGVYVLPSTCILHSLYICWAALNAVIYCDSVNWRQVHDDQNRKCEQSPYTHAKIRHHKTAALRHWYCQCAQPIGWLHLLSAHLNDTAFGWGELNSCWFYQCIPCARDCAAMLALTRCLCQQGYDFGLHNHDSKESSSCSTFSANLYMFLMYFDGACIKAV